MLAETDRLVGLLLDRLPGDCALLVTADHGQVAVRQARRRRLTPDEMLVPLLAAYGRA